MTIIVHCEEGAVCGCPEWWGLYPDPDVAPIDSLEALDFDNPNHEKTSQTASSQLDKVQTCFFWYHTGNCNRLRDRGRCTFVHTVEAGSVVEPPPGFMHYERCELPLCPLRVGSGVTVWPGMTQMERRHAGDAAAIERKKAKKKRWIESIKARKKESQLLGANPALHDFQSGKSATNGNTQKHGGRKQQQALISLHGRGLASSVPGPPESPQSGELFSDEEAPNEDWYLTGFPNDKMDDTECGAMEEGSLQKSWVLQPGDTVLGPDIMTAMWHAAGLADADAPA